MTAVTEAPAKSAIWNAAAMDFGWGFNVIPIAEKRPFTNWALFQEAHQTREQVRELPWKDSRTTGYSAFCGIGGLVVVDFDKQDNENAVNAFLFALDLPVDYAHVVRTPGGGFHASVLCPQFDEWIKPEHRPMGGRLDRPGTMGAWDEKGQPDRQRPHIELRYGSDCLVVRPPSLHPCGKHYAWLKDTPTTPPQMVTAEALYSAYESVTLELPVLPAVEPPIVRTDIPAEYKDRYQQWCIEIEQAAVHAWKIAPPRSNGHSRQNIPCPFHEDRTPSANWNFQTHGLRCFSCDEDFNTHRIADLLGLPSWEETKKAFKPERVFKLHEHAPNGNGHKPPAPTIRIVDSDTALQNILGWTLGEGTPTESILSPYSCLHHLGGFAKLWEPRKLIYIVSGGGLGKTAFIETGLDILRQRGHDVIMWGPEWSPEEVQMKAVARYGGPSFTAQRESQMWHSENAKGVPVDRRNGKLISDDQLSQVLHRIDLVSKWPGKAIYIDSARASLDQILKTVERIVTERRAAGRKVSVLAFDYLQKARNPRGQGVWSELEDKANLIGQTCIDLNLVGIIASQVGKANSRSVRAGQVIDSNAGQSVSDHLPNLYLTLSPKFTKDGARLEQAWLAVMKNSSGIAPARVLVETALHRHLWTNNVVSDDEEEYHPKKTFVMGQD
jgi:hypothetical protein